MKTSLNGINFIKRHEGLRLESYKCDAGKWSIGYGHTLGVTSDMTITNDEADKYLQLDIQRCERAINRYDLKLKQHEFDALASFIFNVGIGAFMTSTLLMHLLVNYSNDLIVKQLGRWVYIDGRVNEGLKKRRKAEIQVYLYANYNA